MATPYMVLTLPVVGPAGTFGPTWATYLNAALTTVDSHDHTTGKGVKITPSAINVTTNFDFSSFGLTSGAYYEFVNQSVDQVNKSIYVKSGNLFYKNSGGGVVQITTGTTLNVVATGGIGGNYTDGGSTAAVNYTLASTSYIFLQAPSITADLVGGSLFIYENVIGGKYAKISVPAGLGSNYNITLPSAPPSSKKLLSMDSNGVIRADSGFTSPNDAQNYTITVSVGSGAMTVNLKTLAGIDPTAADPITISFRSPTAATGTYVPRVCTAATSLIVASGATLGQTSAVAGYLYLYAIDNAGTVELAITGTLLTDVAAINTTIMSSGATSIGTVYSTTARTGVSIRLLAAFLQTQTTAGTWAAVPTTISLGNTIISSEKIINGSITASKLSSLNYVISSSSGGHSTTSTSYVDVTNMTVTITTTGRPVSIFFVGSSASGDLSVWQTTKSGSNQSLSTFIRINRNGTEICSWSQSMVVQSSTNTLSINTPTSGLRAFDIVSAGTYTYVLQILTSGVATTFFQYAKMVALEL